MKRYYPRVCRTAHDEHAQMFVHPEGGYVRYEEAQEAIKDAARLKTMIRVVLAVNGHRADDPKMVAELDRYGEKEMPCSSDEWHQFLDEVASNVE